MSIQSCLLLVLVGYVITSVATISFCNIHGKNSCPCTSTLLSGTQPLIGNSCSRCGGGYQSSLMNFKSGNDLFSSSSIVKPALIPETCSCNSLMNPIQDKESVEGPDFPKSSDNTPVDPVSLTLAQRLLDQSKYNIPESKFWFGPSKLPRIDLPKIIHKNIPEERLFAMERDVIELKPQKSKWNWDDSSSQENSSGENSRSESVENSSEIKRTEVTYKEIGYDRIKANNGCDKKLKVSLPPKPIEETPEFPPYQFVPSKVFLHKPKTNPIDYTQAESYEDLADRLDSLVEKTRNKFYENVLKRAHSPRFFGHSIL